MHKLELVYASCGTIPAAQLSSETGTPRAHNVWIATRCLPTVITTCCAQGLVVAAMVCREGTESTRELCLYLVPTAREIPISIAMRRVCDVVVLANECGPFIIKAIGPMVAQWLHAYLGTLGNHDVAVIATRFLCMHQLEMVYASSGTIPAAQLSSETRTPRAHDVWIATRCLPTMITSRGAQCLAIATMVRCECAEGTWELSPDLVPTAREIPICIAMGRVRNVVVLANES
jgi:hypothetical protein